MTARLSSEMLLMAYGRGIFPMAERRDSADLFWVDPEDRGVLPLDGFHLSRSLRRRLRRQPFEIRFDSDFDGVIAGCAARPETWISGPLVRLYGDLFAAGHAHSIEIREGGALVGGVFGVVLGAAFFGESMFSRRTDASKIALAYLVDRLALCGFTLFDTQFVTPHLESLGGLEIPRAAYHAQLDRAIARRARFDARTPAPDPETLIARLTA